MGKGGAQYNINRATQDHFYRYKMPAIQIKIEGRGNGIKTVIDNCIDVGIALNRPPEYVCKFFGFELGAQTQIEKRHEAQPKYIVNGSHTNEFLQDKLDIFIRDWVLCEKCENPETTLRIGKEKKNPSITATCKACGVSYTVTKDQGGRMRKYIQMNSPEKLGFVSGKGTAGDGGNKKQDSEGEDEIEAPDLEGREWNAESNAATDLDARIDRYLRLFLEL